jgi:glycosyltransferase involved in cell wall biosynthesis
MQLGGLRTKGITKQSQENMPLITVVTVVRNGEKTLEQTILSVINQTYRNVEYIVVDGTSTDGTLDIIRKYEDRIDYWVSEPDGGIYDAMNKGIDLTTGDWINFMNSGDSFYNKNVCEIFSSFIKDDVDIYYGDTCLDCEKIINGPKTIYPFFFRMERMIIHQAIFAKRGLFNIKQFNTKYRIVADRDWLMFFHQNSYKIKHIPLTVCTYNFHGVSSNVEKYREDSFVLIKETYGYLGLMFIVIKRFIGKIIRIFGYHA